MSAVLLLAIVADELEEKAAAIAAAEGARDLTVVPAHGLGFPEHMSFLGLTYRGLETVVLGVTDRNTGDRIVARLNQELDLIAPFQGLAFCLPIDHLAGKCVQHLSVGRPREGGASR